MRPTILTLGGVYVDPQRGTLTGEGITLARNMNLIREDASELYAKATDGDALRSLADWTADIETLAALIADPLTIPEVAQLTNIDSTTISSAQWGYLGAASAFGGPLMAAVDLADFITALGGASSVRTALSVYSSAQTDSAITSGIAAHVALSDPHSQYVLESAIGVTVQGYSANLAEWATINPAADVVTFVSAADNAAMRTALDVYSKAEVDAGAVGDIADHVAEADPHTQYVLESAIGVTVQAYDADLTTWAGLTPSAFFQTLVNDADAATARATLAAAGTGVANTFSSNQTFGAAIILDQAAGNYRSVRGYSSGVVRWYLHLGDNTAESGADAGSNFGIWRYDDAGGFLASAMSITRSNGNVSFGSTTVRAGGNTMWHAGNDGSGSGLDADLLRGATPSANGLSLVSAANYAAMRGLLDLEAGTDFYSISAADTLLAAKAPLASPALTGAPTAPTASQATDNTQIATTAFVHDAVDAHVALSDPHTQYTLESAFGSGSVTPSGGSTARTVSAWLGDIRNAKALGVVGDGATNDKTAFDNALSAYQYVSVPKSTGAYVLSTDLTVPVNHMLDLGYGVATSGAGAIIGPGIVAYYDGGVGTRHVENLPHRFADLRDEAGNRATIDADVDYQADISHFSATSMGGQNALTGATEVDTDSIYGTGTTGYCNVTTTDTWGFGLFGRADLNSADSGVTGAELNTFNYIGNIAQTWPPDRSFGSLIAVVATVAPGGDYASFAGVQIAQEGSEPQTCYTGLYINPDVCDFHGVFVDATSSDGAPYAARLRTPGGASDVAVMLESRSAAVHADRTMLSVVDSAGGTQGEITQDGSVMAYGGELFVGRDAEIDGDLTVNTDAEIGGDLDVLGELTVDGTKPTVGGLGIWRMIDHSGAAVVRNSVNAAGDTTETAQVTVTVPANSMGPNGILHFRALITQTGGASTKTWRARLGGISGSAFLNQSTTSSISGWLDIWIWNANATNAQVGPTPATPGTPNFSTGAYATGSQDTTVDKDFVLSNLWSAAASGENMTIRAWSLEVLYGA